MANNPPSRGIILLVEDEPLIRMSVVDYLSEEGYVVEETGTAKAAQARLRDLAGEIEAVVLDLGLPDRPGEELAEEMRATYPDIPIIIASGQSVSEMRRRFADPSGLAFITKPYDFDDLSQTIASCRRTRS